MHAYIQIVAKMRLVHQSLGFDLYAAEQTRPLYQWSGLRVVVLNATPSLVLYR